jgi:hypothetical protein
MWELFSFLDVLTQDYPWWDNWKRKALSTYGIISLFVVYYTFATVYKRDISKFIGETKVAKTMKLPYIKDIGQRGRISIWIVDGSYVRTHLDEEFTNYGQHYNFKYIPRDEFWIDQENSPDEQKFFIDHLVVEHHLMEKGVPYDQVLEAADKAERAERRGAGDVKKMTKGGNLPNPKQVHVRLWKKLETPVSVWIVDGRLVRSVFDDDFTEGGHDYVYEFVPQNEVWIDNDLEQAERPYVLLHELHERNLMAQGLDYDRAHADSSKIEHHCRHHPNELHEALAKEGWE